MTKEHNFSDTVLLFQKHIIHHGDFKTLPLAAVNYHLWVFDLSFSLLNQIFPPHFPSYSYQFVIKLWQGVSSVFVVAQKTNQLHCK